MNPAIDQRDRAKTSVILPNQIQDEATLGDTNSLASSSGWRTAAMPPWAYQVFDSPIVSLVSSTTSAPPSAAAIEERRPATPPPITKTSVNCCGRRAALKESR